MSKLLLNFTCILITVLALNGCDRSSIPTSPIDSESVTPTEVANLKATIVDESKILLTWEDEALNERGFEIFERSGSESEFILLMRTAANVTIVLIDKHRRAFDYYYKVRAINGIGASGFSDQAHVVGFHKAVTVSGSGSLRDITFSPDGSQIAGVGSWQTSTDHDADFGNLVIANASSGELIHLLETSSNYPYSGSSCLSYSPDGGTLTLGNELGEIECWDAINGELIISEMIMPRKDYWHWWGSGVSDLTYNNNGRFITVAGNDDDISSIAILRANSLKLYYPKLNFSGMIADFEFSPDSYMLAVLVDGGSNKGVLSLHRAEDGHDEGLFEFEIQGAPSISYHPDGKKLAISTGLETIILDYQSLEIVSILPLKGTEISYTQNGNFIASLYSSISFWNSSTGNEEFNLFKVDIIKEWSIPSYIVDYTINPVNSSIAIYKPWGSPNSSVVQPGLIPGFEIWY